METNRQDRRSSCACLLSLSLILAAVTPTSATAVTFQVEITDAIYQVQAADTYADLLLQHQAGNLLSSNSLAGVSGITAPIEAGVNTDYSMLITTTLNIAVGGTYEFQVGTDWGRGSLRHLQREWFGRL